MKPRSILLAFCLLLLVVTSIFFNSFNSLLHSNECGTPDASGWVVNLEDDDFDAVFSHALLSQHQFIQLPAVFIITLIAFASAILIPQPPRRLSVLRI